MQKVFNSLEEIEKVVAELLPPRLNKYIGSFNLIFLLSSTVWNLEEEWSTTFVGERGITYQVCKASVEEEIEYLQSILDPYGDYSDDPAYWKDIQYIKSRIKMLESYEN
jgi:hypothetical protein